MLVTLFGIVTLVKPLQSENAYSPILVTGYPLRVEGMMIAPFVDDGIAGVFQLPLLISALPLDTLYVHVMPSTVSVSA